MGFENNSTANILHKITGIDSLTIFNLVLKFEELYFSWILLNMLKTRNIFSKCKVINFEFPD